MATFPAVASTAANTTTKPLHRPSSSYFSVGSMRRNWFEQGCRRLGSDAGLVWYNQYVFRTEIRNYIMSEPMFAFRLSMIVSVLRVRSIAGWIDSFRMCKEFFV